MARAISFLCLVFLPAPPASAQDPGAPAVPAVKPPPHADTIEIETTGGRESLPLAEVSRLAIAPGSGAAKPQLILDARKIPVDDVLSIRLPIRPPGGTPGRFLLLLRSGSEVAGAIAGGDDTSIRFRAGSLGSNVLSVRLEDVKGLIVENAAGGEPKRDGTKNEAAARQRLRSQIAKGKPEKDAVVLLEGGRVEGVLEKFEEDGIRFGSDALGDVKIAYEKVRAVALAAVGEPSPAGGNTPPGGPEARVTLRDGTRVTAAVTGLASGKLSLEEPVLRAITVSLDDVLDVAFLNGRSVYLSDREPVKVVERLGPAFRKSMPHRKDENVLGEPIRLGGREHPKGLGVHSYSLLEYDLGGQFARFEAVIGLDDSARAADVEPGLSDFAEVVFRVRLDGKLLLEKRMSWRDPPLPIDLPLVQSASTGATAPASPRGKLLSLEVDYGAPEGGFNFALDRADWADARVVR